jgi:MscS family membrane protein
MTDYLDKFVRLFESDFGWMIQVFVVVLLTLIAGWAVRQVIQKLARHARHTKSRVDDVLFDAMTGPARALVWVLGISFAVQIVGVQTNESIFDAIGWLRRVAIVLVMMWFGLRYTSMAEKSYIERKTDQGEGVDMTLIQMLAKMSRAAIVITSSLIVLHAMGVSVGGLLAAGGVGGIAMGLAAQDTLANLFGGMTIYMDRPFHIGDWIRSPDREIEGTVEDIGWRRTVIRTFDMRPLYVPNSVFSTIAVENPTRMLNRRIKETIGVRYDDIEVVPAILADVREYLTQSKDIDQSKTLMVNLNDFGDSSVDFFIYTFTRTTRWTEFHAVKETVLLRISDIISKHGAEIAYPTSTLHVPDGINLKAIDKPG